MVYHFYNYALEMQHKFGFKVYAHEKIIFIIRSYCSINTRMY